MPRRPSRTRSRSDLRGSLHPPSTPEPDIRGHACPLIACNLAQRPSLASPIKPADCDYAGCNRFGVAHIPGNLIRRGYPCWQAVSGGSISGSGKRRICWRRERAQLCGRADRSARRRDRSQQCFRAICGPSLASSRTWHYGAEAFGGLGLGYLEHCVVMEEISRASGARSGYPTAPTPISA